MSTVQNYRTVEGEHRFEFKEKASKFIGISVGVSDEEEIKRYLTSWREEHPNANHVCFAYRLGKSGEQYRYSDDGEPSNSAGAPIYGQLLAHDVSYSLVGVVRYFGGTKLGVGGLKSAYKEAADLVLSESKIVLVEQKRLVTLNMSYAEMPSVMSVLKHSGLTADETVMNERCELHFRLSADNEINFKQLLWETPEVEIDEKYT